MRKVIRYQQVSDAFDALEDMEAEQDSFRELAGAILRKILFHDKTLTHAQKRELLKELEL